MRLRILSALFAASLAAPAWGQAPPQPPPQPASPDVIGSLLDQHGRAPGDEDEPDVASEPRPSAEAEPALQSGAAPERPLARPKLTAPVHLEETGKTPDSPPTVRDMAYENRIRSSFASAEGFQGPLDGGWTMSAGGQDLYSLQIVDRRDRLEGVWRDVRRKGALNASGLVDDMQRQGSDLTLRFTPAAGAPTTVVVLHDGGAGHWTGELTEAGQRRSVSLRRTGPY